MPRIRDFRRFAAALALAATFAAAAGGAAPLPAVRTAVTQRGDRAARALAPSSAAADASGLERGIASACGARAESGVTMLAEHAARNGLVPLPTTYSTDVNGIAVLEDDGTFFYRNKGGDPIADLAAIGQSFYRTHGDDYDCLAVYLASGLSTYLGSATSIAAAFLLRNDIRGIGEDPFDVGAGFGSPARLQWMLSMNGLDRYPADPLADISGDSFNTLDVLAHEFGHRWLAYTLVDSAGTPSTALLGRALQHWSFFFDADSSYMEGCDWISPAPDSFRTDGVSGAYGNLDLYLMGLRSAAETDSFFTIHDATDFDPPANYVPWSSPFVGLGCRGRAHWWSVADIAALYGPRMPDAASAPHTLRLGFVLVTPRGQPATGADLAEIANLRDLFPDYFRTATRGLGTVDPTLVSRAGRVVIAHAPPRDRVDPSAPVPIAASVRIDQAGIPLALAPASVRAFWRAGTSGPFAPVPLVAAAADTFAGALPATGTAGDVQYYLYAASDSAGIDAFAPPAGPAAPFQFHVGPDLTPPVVVHVPIEEQGEARMPVSLLARVTDNVALAATGVHWGMDGAITNFNWLLPAGRDSFALDLGWGFTAGHTLDYYFEARDSAGNVTFAGDPARGGLPYSTSVGKDWAFDFENGAVGGVFHVPIYYSYRDAWHTVQESSSPAGGTAWKCGADAPLPYPSHLDAGLYLPLIDAVVPGTELRFDHRFELEQNVPGQAWDGARVEIQVGSGPWTPLVTQGGYDDEFIVNSNPFEAGSPCWSGSSGGWRSEVADLSPYAPGPVRVRFRMLTDDLDGFDGWLVDHVRVHFPAAAAGVASDAAAITTAPWPNPARATIHQSVAIPRGGRGEWALYDLAGRRAALLRAGEFAAGRSELSAALPPGLSGGVYFLRLAIAGREPITRRVAIVR